MNNEFLVKALNSFEKNAAKFYLIAANLVLVIFAIWFSNVGLLPFIKTSDFAFFAILAFSLGVYRPSWAFAFFIGTLALENINLAPESLGLALRPYQLFGFITMAAVFIGFFTKRLNFSLPKWRWFDLLSLMFVVGGFMSSLAAVNHGAAFKQAVVAASFVSFYYLTRIYIQSFDDLKRILPFFLSSGIVVSLYGIWQNIRFLTEKKSFEAMLGRPNATFTEPDWLGIYLVFLLSIIFSMIYYFISVGNKKESSFTGNQSLIHQAKKTGSITDDRLPITALHVKKILLYGALVLIIIVLFLTVARSAWLGAALVTIGFLKIVLTNGSFKISQWNWREFIRQLVALVFVVVISLLVSTQLTNFQIFNRAQSTGGLQKITISCEKNAFNIPKSISNIEELSQYGCKHINLEDIEKEKSEGNVVMEIERPDPSVGIRAQIYKKSLEQIKKHLIFGIGWGGISDILGKDENGVGLNASNIFLETWLGAGILGILSLTILLLYILFKSAAQYLNRKVTNKIVATFVALGWFAIVIPNLFNSGIFLGFVWIYGAVAVSLLVDDNSKK